MAAPISVSVMAAVALLLLLQVVFCHPSPPSVDIQDSNPHLSSSSAHNLLNRPSPRLVKALSRVHRLQSANICIVNRFVSKNYRTPCPPFTFDALASAVSRLESEAQRDRIRRRLQRPLYRTFILEPFEGIVDTTILFLHGYGDNVRDFIKIIYPALRKRGFLPRTRIIMPQARPQYDPFFNRSDVPSWFQNIADFKNWNGHDVSAAAGSVASALDVTCKLLGASRERAGVTGISQGGGLSVAVYMRYKVAAAGSIVGFLPVPESYPNEMTTMSQDSPILWVSSTTDQLVKIEWARLGSNKLRRLGRNIEYVELKGLPHSLGKQRTKYVKRMFSFVHKEIAKLPGAKSNKTVEVNLSNEDPVIWELK